jgi:SAM-dependent methyltransferase
MGRYVLEDIDENQRLEKQASLSQYQVGQEFRSLKLKGSERVLDAGCGSGLLGRYFSALYPDIEYLGIDVSEARICEAKSVNGPTLNFTNADLFNLEELITKVGKVDLILNRYVMHHLPEHLKVLENFYQLLERDGKVFIVDIDGIFINIGSDNKELIDKVNILGTHFGGDLQVGRRLPSLMKRVGFRNIDWDIQPMVFKGQDKTDEVEQFRERLGFAMPVIQEILGSEFEAKRFVKDYLNELSKPETTIFYNKFIVHGVK